MTTFRKAPRALRVLGALALAVGLLTAAAPMAFASGAPAYLRLAHLSPDTPDVDVYVASVSEPALSFVVPGVGYGSVSPYRALPAGDYVVSMRAAGAPVSAPVVISTSVDARPGGAYTVAGVGMSAKLGLSVLTDRLDAPAPGRATVRVINGAASAPTVDVGPVGGPAWATGVRFGTDTPYTEVPLGPWTLQVTAPGRPTTSLPVRLNANSVYTVLLLDRGGALRTQLIRDSVGSGVVPVGGVETGLGGTAPGSGTPQAVLVAGLAVAVVAGGLLIPGVGRARGH